MLPGVRVRDLTKVIDERGSFAELMRQDWKEFLENDVIAQSNLSFSLPGIVRAWHRHDRGQVDYLTVLKGVVKICSYDDVQGSQTRNQLDEIVASEEKLQLVRIPGRYWHGTKTLGNSPSVTLYQVTRVYDSQNPDEERRPWNDSAILDPKTSKPFDWNRPLHK